MKKRKFADGGETEELVTPESEEAAKARSTARLLRILPEKEGSPYVPEPDEPSRVFASPNRFAGPAAKPKVVTMEQVKKAGFSELRDYLNAQQNLKPRKANPTLGEARNSAEQAAADKVDYGQVLQSREQGRTRGSPSYDSAGKPSNAGPDVIRKKPKNITKMAGGGSVSSRADGIAQRGKTRGKMC
jgi:hypothetical protein